MQNANFGYKIKILVYKVKYIQILLLRTTFWYYQVKMCKNLGLKYKIPVFKVKIVVVSVHENNWPDNNE